MEFEKMGSWPKADLEDVQVCPICRSDNYLLLYRSLRDTTFEVAPGKWNLMKCNDCGTLFLNPRPTLASIGRAYENYYTHASSTPNMVPSKPTLRLGLWNGYINRAFGYHLRPEYPIGYPLMRMMPYRRLLNDRIFRSITLPRNTPHPRLLDVGCGSGQFLNFIQKLGWEGYGIDTDSKAIAAANQLQLHVANTALLPDTFPSRFFDAITMNHVIEHVHDPISLLKICHKILKPSGILWIATPNALSLSHKKFGRHWRGIESPRHVVLFTPKSLRIALQHAGFAVPQLIGSSSDPWMYHASYQLGVKETVGETLPSTSAAPFWIRGEASLIARLAVWNPNIAAELIMQARV